MTIQLSMMTMYSIQFGIRSIAYWKTHLYQLLESSATREKIVTVKLSLFQIRITYTLKEGLIQKKIDQNRWHIKAFAPGIGSYPIPRRVEKGTVLYELLFTQFIEAEKSGEIRLY